MEMREVVTREELEHALRRLVEVADAQAAELEQLRAEVEVLRAERAAAEKFAASITVGVGSKDAEDMRVGVPLTTENASRARVVECDHCAFIVDVGDDNTWWCNGWVVGVDYLLRRGATVLAWRSP